MAFTLRKETPHIIDSDKSEIGFFDQFLMNNPDFIKAEQISREGLKFIPYQKKDNVAQPSAL
jgi:hypothetical protein